jgi:hypothetical protein
VAASAQRIDAPALGIPRYAPVGAGERAAVTAPARDVSLDLLRGLAMVILVVNHIHLESALEVGTRALLSAAEVLVSVSGVVVGMVFGRRWLKDGARATTLMLLRRARKLYVASVVVVAIVGVLTLVPWLDTQALAVSPSSGGAGTYAFDGPLRLALAVVTLEAGPWQFNILGFFIVSIALTPVVLALLERGHWPLLLVASWGIYLAGRRWQVDVLPMQSEGPFPLPIWQLLYVHGIVLGFHRERVARLVRASGGAIVGALVAVAAVAAALRLQREGVDALAAAGLAGGRDWAAWDLANYDKTTLDIARVLTMTSLAGALYAGLRRIEPHAERTLGVLLLPLGRNSFYVFIMHVFFCLAVASLPLLAGEGLGGAGNVLAQLGCVALLWLMVTRRFMFRWVPR